MGPTQILLQFIDRHLGKLPAPARVVVVFVVVAVLAVYLLNGFVAPTFVRGHLAVRETRGGGLLPARNYTLEHRSVPLVADRWGNWILPVYRSGIPRQLKVRIHDQDGAYLDKVSLAGPLPVWSALFPKEYDIEVHVYEEEGERIKMSGRLDWDHVIAGVARWIVGVATAQPSPGQRS